MASKAQSLVQALLEASEEEFDLEDLVVASGTYAVDGVMKRLKFLPVLRSSYERQALSGISKATCYYVRYKGPPIPVLVSRPLPMTKRTLQVQAAVWTTPQWNSVQVRLEVTPDWWRTSDTVYKKDWTEYNDPSKIAPKIQADIERVYRRLTDLRVTEKNVRQAVRRSV